MKIAISLAATALAYGVWRLTPLVLDPLGLGEFLFVGRLCLILAALSAAETGCRKLLPS